MREVAIQTRDGSCRSFVFDAPAPAPAVLVYMDGLGIRPAMLELGERLSTYGYYVLLPDLFYRSGPYEPMEAAVFVDPAKRKILMEKFGLATPMNIMSDTVSFLEFLDKERPGPIGTTGYCMGGHASLLAAGTFPDRIVATASYHGARLANPENPDSPHLLASKIKSRVYLGVAKDDHTFPEDQKVRLEAALTEAHVDYTLEMYDAQHGWVFRDIPIYDKAGEERHWETLVALLDATLKNK